MNWPAYTIRKPLGASHRYIQTSLVRPCAPLLVGLMAQAAIGGLSSSALAEEWIVIPSIGVKQSFTDNARQAPRGSEKADTFTSVTPGVSVTGTGARLNVNLDYTFTRNQYFDNTDLSGNRHNLLGGGTAELIPELLFFDARAAIFQQSVDPTGAQSVSTEGNTSNTNTRTVKTYSLSPYLRNRFGGFADSELRYSFYQTRQGAAGTTTTNRITETLNSGDDFTRFRWVGLLDASETKASNTGAAGSTVNDPFGGPPRDSAHRLALFSPEYVVNRYLILLSGLGYEKIEDPTLREEFDGPIGNAGVRVNPGPRSTFRVLWNHRYDSNYFTGDGSYLIGPTTRIDAAYTRDVQTSSSMYSENLTYLGTDQYGNFIDTRSLATFQLDNQAFGLSNAAFLQERYSLRFTTELQRDSFNAELYRETRESQNALATQTTDGVSLNWGHSLSEVMSLNVGVRYTESEFSSVDVGGKPREDQTVRGGPGLSYRFNETLTGSMNYDFLYRFSNAAAGDLKENIVSVGVRKTF